MRSTRIGERCPSGDRGRRAPSRVGISRYGILRIRTCRALLSPLSEGSSGRERYAKMTWSLWKCRPTRTGSRGFRGCSARRTSRRRYPWPSWGPRTAGRPGRPFGATRDCLGVPDEGPVEGVRSGELPGRAGGRDCVRRPRPDGVDERPARDGRGSSVRGHRRRGAGRLPAGSRRPTARRPDRCPAIGTGSGSSRRGRREGAVRRVDDATAATTRPDDRSQSDQDRSSRVRSSTVSRSRTILASPPSRATSAGRGREWNVEVNS